MRFTIDSKKLKEMIGKISTVTPKKGACDISKIMLSVNEANKGVLVISGTNIEDYLELTGNIWGCVTDGWTDNFLIDINDIMLVTKLTGNITFSTDYSEFTDNNGRLIGNLYVKCGKKQLTFKIAIFDSNNDSFRIMPEGVDVVSTLETSESWLLYSLMDLANFTLTKSDGNIMMRNYNFNLEKKRLEAVDGHKLGVRSFEENVKANVYNQVLTAYPNGKSDKKDKAEKKINYDIQLPNNEFPVLKKLLNRGKSNNNQLEISKYTVKRDNSYCYYIKGEDFKLCYKSNNEQEFFDISRMLPDSSYGKCSFKPNRENLLEVSKYCADLVKKDTFEKKPMFIREYHGGLYAYVKAVAPSGSPLEDLEEIEVEVDYMSKINNFISAYNPAYIADIMSVVDSDKPFCNTNGEKSPMIITGNEYKFLVLPVNINGMGTPSDIDKSIERLIVA